jgi:phage portal protein BeeE
VSRNFFQRAAAWLVQKSGLSATQFLTGNDLDGASKGLSNPYQRSAWVLAAVRRVVQPISSVELYLSENDEQIDDPGLEEFWSAPALNADGSRMGQADFIETLGAWLLLSGEYFLILDETWRVPFPEIATRTPLIIARPDRMQEVVRHGQLLGWRWNTAAGRVVELDASRVIQVKLFNPYDEWRGLSPLKAAEIAAGADYASAQFAKNIAEANGDQGMIVVAKGGIPSDEQRKQIVEQLRAKTAAQRKGIFRPIFLGGDVTIEDPKVRSMDASFVSQRLENRKEIAAAFGVPASFFDPQASYSVGAASDRYILIEETCKPLSRKTNGGLTRVAKLQTGRDVCVESDWDDHSVMQAVRQERVDTGIKLWNTGMPMEKVSDYLRLDLPEYDGWEVGYLPFSVAPTGEPKEMTTEPTLEDQPPADPVEEMRRLFAQRAQLSTINHQPSTDSDPDCACCSGPVDLVIRAGDSADVKLWKSRMAVRRETMAAYTSKFTRLLMLARREVLQKLEQHPEFAAKTGAPATRAAAIDFLFDLSKWGPQFQVAMRSVAADALQKAGDQVFAEVKRDDPWKMPSAEAMRFLRDRENRLRGVPEDVHAKIKEALQTGLDEGKPLREIANDVRATFNEISDRRARTIATTETSAAFGKGRHLAMRAAGVQWKRWLVSGNSNVRASHRSMSGTVIPVEEMFEVTNLEAGSKEYGAVDYIMHPADSNGAPWNVINCNCIELAVAEPPTAEVEPS